jgi:hypothetical protein
MKSTRKHNKPIEPISTNLQIENLMLDPLNPRLKNRETQASQIDLAKEIAIHYDALSLARLIATNGFYVNQALLVYKNEADRYIVAEGNRRLTAVLGLTDANYREQFQNKSEWTKLSETENAKNLTSVPVYIYDGPTTLRPIIAAEHLNRKLSWEPFQKAREIVSLVDIEGHSFNDISEFSGIQKSELKRMYRDFKAAKNLIKSGFSESLITGDFSKVGEITKIPSLLEFTGIPSERDVEPGQLELDEMKKDQRLEIFEMVFGEDSITPDSRQIRDLGKVVSEPESLNHLRETNDLAESLEIYKLKKENNIESTAKLFAKSLDSLSRLYSKIAINKSDPVVAPLVERAKDLLAMISKL